MIKRAFTIIELIFVIIIIGIIAVTATTVFKKDTLAPATIQVLDHIRYTQQLALNEDKFVPAPEFSTEADTIQDSKFWFRKWWQIKFTGTTYNVFTDNDQDGTADADEFATDPQTQAPIGDSNALMDLGSEYDIASVTVGGDCAVNDAILFDNLGRPYCGKHTVDADPPYVNLATANITITLNDGTDTRVITIVPITGYASLN